MDCYVNPDPRCWCCGTNRDSQYACERCVAHGAWRGPLPESARQWLAKETARVAEELAKEVKR